MLRYLRESGARFQFALIVAISLHALAAAAMLDYSRIRDKSPAVVASVMKMNWEVASPSRSEKSFIAKKTSGSIPSTERVQAAHTNPPAADSRLPTTAQNSDAQPMENYLSSLRDRLGDAIHLHQPKGTANSELVLKVTIHSSGSVEQIEIVKSTGQPEVDRAVLSAFESLQPLSPFPEEWKKSPGSPQSVTVKIPIMIRPRAR